MRSLWAPYTFWAHWVCAFRLSMSMTRGAMACTRGSTAALSQVVQPRLEAPETTNRSMFWLNSFRASACTASQQFRNVGLTPGVFAERPVFSLWPSAIALKGGWPPPWRDDPSPGVPAPPCLRRPLAREQSPERTAPREGLTASLANRQSLRSKRRRKREAVAA